MTGILTSPLLSQLACVEHGFGTRDAVFSQTGMVSLRQIHSSLLRVADRDSGCAGEGDALITDRPGVRISVRTADCFPVLIADPNRRVVAAVHAGWRGTAARIVGHVVQKMIAEFGSKPAEIHAAIGPGIGACCYEVGAEVARQFGLDRAGTIDLAHFNREQLLAASVPETQIDTIGGCTFCDPARFHSYRRDGARAGRMISFIRVLDSVPA